MKIEIGSTQFNKFIKQSKIVNTDSILVDARDNTVELIKCDIENQVSQQLQANIEEPGTVILPKEVFPLVKNDSIMTILDDRIIIGSRVIKLDLQRSKDYPRIDGDFKHNVFELTDKDIKQLLEVEHAVSNDLTKPILNTIRIENNKFIAIDGYRLCERIGDFKSDIPINISNYKMLKGLRGNIKATCSDKHIKYQVGDLNFYNRLIEGDFIDVDKLKPKEYNTIIDVDKAEFLEVLQSMEKVSMSSKNTLVMLDINEKLIHIKAKNENIKLEDTIKCSSIKHDKLTMGFNCKYLIDAIKSMHKNIKMSFTTNVNPVILESPGKYELILPVRVSCI